MAFKNLKTSTFLDSLTIIKSLKLTKIKKNLGNILTTKVKCLCLINLGHLSQRLIVIGRESVQKIAKKLMAMLERKILILQSRSLDTMMKLQLANKITSNIPIPCKHWQFSKCLEG